VRALAEADADAVVLHHTQSSQYTPEELIRFTTDQIRPVLT
jgi:hypothetical protein